jgi:hypothetical protein
MDCEFPIQTRVPNMFGMHVQGWQRVLSVTGLYNCMDCQHYFTLFWAEERFLETVSGRRNGSWTTFLGRETVPGKRFWKEEHFLKWVSGKCSPSQKSIPGSTGTVNFKPTQGFYKPMTLKPSASSALARFGVEVLMDVQNGFQSPHGVIHP